MLNLCGKHSRQLYKNRRQKGTIQIDTRKTYPSMDKYNHQKKNRSETKSPQKGQKDLKEKRYRQVQDTKTENTMGNQKN